jgi:hypothetical protein
VDLQALTEDLVLSSLKQVERSVPWVVFDS